MNRPLTRQETPEEFALETRFVVLNFLSLVPTKSASPSLNESLTSSSSSDRSRALSRSFGEATNITDVSEGGAQWQRTLPTLPEASVIEKVMHTSSDMDDETDALSASPTKSLGGRWGNDLTRLMPDSEDEIDIVDGTSRFTPGNNLATMTLLQDSAGPRGVLSLRNLARAAQDAGEDEVTSGMPVRTEVEESLNGIVIPQSSSHSQVPDRQISEYSSSSDMSLPMSECSSLWASGRTNASSRSTYIDVQQADVTGMVRSGALPPSCLPLREELTKEMTQLVERARNSVPTTPKSQDLSDLPVFLSDPPVFTPPIARSPFSRSQTHRTTTPETEVAECLRQIGDKVESEYGQQIALAVNSVLCMPRDKVDFNYLQGIAVSLIHHTTSGWTKVTLLLLLGQKIASGMLQQGQRGLGELTEFIAKLIEDQTAEFILSRGGWHSITGLDAESPVSISGITPMFHEEAVGGAAPPEVLSAIPGSTSFASDRSNASTDTISPDFFANTPERTPIMGRSFTYESPSTPTPGGNVEDRGRDTLDGPDGSLAVEGATGSLTPENNNSIRKNSRSGLNLDITAAAAAAAASSAAVSGEGTPNIEKAGSNAATFIKNNGIKTSTPEVDAVRQEISLLRQYSNELDENTERDRRHRWQQNLQTGAALTLLGGLMGYIVYKKYKK